MKYFSISADCLREVIQGKIEFRKCPNCDKEGIELQAYNDNDEPCNPDDKDAIRQTCIVS